MKRSLKLIIAGVLTVALVWLLLSQVSLSDIIKALAAVGPLWLAVSFGIYLLSTTLRAARFSVFMKGRIKFLQMLRIVYLHNLANNILPSFIGELSFIVLAKKTGKSSTGEAAAALVASRLFDLAAVFGLTAAALFIYPDAPPVFRTMLLIFGGVLALAFLLLAAFVVFRERANSMMMRIATFLGLARFSVVSWGIDKIHEMAESLHIIRNGKTMFIAALVSIAVWLLAYAQSWVLILAMGFEVSFIMAMLGTSLYRIASSLPVYGIGGFGTVELTWSAAFIVLGMTTSSAIVSGFTHHIILLSYAVLLGVVATWIGARE